MLAALLSKSGSRPAFTSQLQQLRFLNVHEYQGAELMAKFGVNVPTGIPAFTLSEVESAARKLADEKGEIVLKSQILAGGRGLGKFTNGLQGGVHIVKAEQAKDLAAKMLHQTLVTKQTGPSGKPVNTLYIAKKMKLAREMYFAILLDRKTSGPIIIACSEGGTSIEDLAEKYPEKIIKVPIDIRQGLTASQADQVVAGLEVQGDKAAAAKQVQALYDVFVKTDCTMVEVNPLAETPEGHLLAADAKLGFDDNAAYRQKAVFDMKDDTQIDPREVAASKYDLNYIGLDGNIGCMVNGAGLAMATMDIIKLHGGAPANFLDVGGNASEQQVIEAFKILTSDKQVKAILVNIFGGIMKCDIIASGIVNAAKQVGVQVPLVVRLEGTNVEKGKDIIKNSGLAIVAAEDLDDAAKKACATITA
ncbi:succinyl-CoA synthetase beta chain [Haematococcus lacustris]|uniref:Succinate--CoA ligase [ADP-forming] subunit beta, mitochondrial n=1 Tax=Haematococcus lacustris TaxID=44745 RepID=A0A6A0AFS9_HAELA|nr:succinyl-CoA synthetase beta chain [Haematococcus lacustris]